MSLKVGQKSQLYATRPLGGAYHGVRGGYIENRGLVRRLDAYDTYQAPVYHNTCSAGESPIANRFDRFA